MNVHKIQPDSIDDDTWKYITTISGLHAELILADTLRQHFEGKCRKLEVDVEFNRNIIANKDAEIDDLKKQLAILEERALGWQELARPNNEKRCRYEDRSPDL